MSLSGSFFCGAVRFTVDGPLQGVITCHCTDCQKLNGTSNALVVADKTAFTLEGEAHVRWYQTSAEARRSFCDQCGTRLFKDKGTDKIIISAGTFDPPLALANAKNIWTDHQPAWVALAPEGG